MWSAMCFFTPKIHFLVLFSNQMKRDGHKKGTDAKRDVWGTFLSIFRTLRVLLRLPEGHKIWVLTQKWWFFDDLLFPHQYLHTKIKYEVLNFCNLTLAWDLVTTTKILKIVGALKWPKIAQICHFSLIFGPQTHPKLILTLIHYNKS